MDNSRGGETVRALRIAPQSAKGTWLVPFGSAAFVPKADMIRMSSLTEEALLHNLRVRYAHDDIYTAIGDILISVNPFKQLRLYTPSILATYLHPQSDGGTLAPHIYSSAMLAHETMVHDHNDQSLIISGESGAGKTECMKLLLQYLTEKSRQLVRSRTHCLSAFISLVVISRYIHGWCVCE